LPFLNPYHFVPFPTGPRNEVDDLPVAQIRNSPHARHDRYVPGKHSGRIVCRLTTEDPIFIGRNRTREATREEPALVPNFEVGGQPAIPASSLRGLISSLAEAASNSAMRVLQDVQYSYRKRMVHSLSAIGMLIRRDNGWWLRPLTAAHNVPANAAGMRRKVYFGNHYSIRQNGTDDFPFETFDIHNPRYYYMRLIPGSFNFKGPLIVAQHSLDDRPISQTEFDTLPQAQQAQYTRGILRVLGVAGREDIPVYVPPGPGVPERHGKKHELFLPYPEGIEAEQLLPVPESIIARFHALADERTAESVALPYELQGMRRQDNGQLRLEHGSLVYYAGNALGVTEVSLSAIWRAAPSADGGQRASTHQYFKEIDRQLVPSKYWADLKNAKITVAEQLFGFVEQRPTNEASPRQGLALAGRLRFSTGIFDRGPEGDLYLPEVTLKILASPKPPSPALYFRQQGNWARRAENLNPVQARPKGRKFYWHKSLAAGEPWRHVPPPPGLAWSYLQQVRVRPVRSTVCFRFDVHFDNLSDRELGLLLYALRPDEAFRHKLGMGKAIGLGKVRIDIQSLDLIDRQKRYTAEALLEATARFSPCDEVDIQRFRDSFVPDPLVGFAIKWLGNPAVAHPVHYPTAINQGAYSEKELFKWFVNNNAGDQPLPMRDLTPPANNQPPQWPTLQPNQPPTPNNAL
jgi:hypothetical protein